MKNEHYYQTILIEKRKRMLFVEFGEFVEETVAETHQFYQSTRLSEGARAGVVFLVFRFMGQKNQSEVLLCWEG